MKRLILSVGLLAVILMIICEFNHADRKNCVCSILTADMQTFQFDSRLYRVCEKETLKPGTIRIVRTKCDHGKNIYLCIMPDEGKYTGYLLSE